jgi:DeoR/GlpR family transcriptional regulator of sugar metabolism
MKQDASFLQIPKKRVHDAGRSRPSTREAGDKSFTAVKRATRQVDLLHLLQAQGALLLNDLAERLGVSGSTLRRDLRELEEAGVVRVVSGRVEVSAASGAEMPFGLRALLNHAEKARIAGAALELIQNGETIFIAGGSTALELARRLPGQRRLTVITNSVRVANILIDVNDIQLILLGGSIRSGEQTLHGHLTEWGVHQMRADKLFYGVQAISLQHGLTHGQMVEVSTDRALAEASSQVIVLADHTKFGQVAPALVLPLSKVHTIITGIETPAETIAALQKQGVKVMAV